MPTLPTIKKGSKGSAVKYCQERLVAKGFHLTVDGDFGPKTDAVVREYQASENLQPDGIVGPQTWNRLLSEGQVKPPSDLLDDKKKALIARIPKDAPDAVKKVLTLACKDLGLKEVPNGSNAGPEIEHLVAHYNQYWWRLKDGVDLNKVKARGYPLESECKEGQAWCCMACMSWIRLGLGLPDWDYKAGFRKPLNNHPFTYFLGNGGQVEEWGAKNGKWVAYPKADDPVPGGAVFTVSPSWSNSDTTTGQGAGHVGMIVCDLGDGRVLTIEGNVSNGVGSYKRKKKDLRGYAVWW